MPAESELFWKKGSMSLIWLCSTLGPKHKKGPSRKELQQCDVPDVCQKIVNPVVPLPLRATAGLLFGVVRVHDAHYEIFGHDVATLETNVRKAMVDMRTSGGGLIGGMDMANGAQARPDQINVVVKPIEEARGGKHWLVTQTTDWEAFLEEYNGNHGAHIEEDESAVDSGREGTPSDRADRHVADPKDITLPGHRYRAASYGIPQRMSVDPEQDFINEEGIDLGLDMGDMTGMDLDEPQQQQTTRRRKGGAGSDFGGFSVGPGGVPSSSAFGGALNDLEGDIELGLDGFDDINVDPPNQSLERDAASHRPQDPEGDAMMIDLDTGADPAIHKDAIPVEGDEANQNKKKKKKVAILDQNIELTAEQFRGMKNGWGTRMDKEREAVYSKELAKDWYTEAEVLVVGGPMMTLGIDGELKSFWNTLMDVRRPPERQAVLQQDWQRGISSNDNPYPLAENLEGDLDDLGQFNPDDFGGMEIEPEIGRRYRAGTHDTEMEVGRRQSQASDKKAPFPWEVDEPYNRDIDDILAGPGSSITGTGARFSIDTPRDGQLRRRARSSSILSMGAPGSIAAFQTRGLDSQSDLELPGSNLDRQSQAEAGSTQQSSLVPSTGKFLDYLKRIAANNGDDVFDADQAIDFAQVAPPESANRRVAAGAFYKCLTLATKSLIQVNQKKAYGNIAVTIKRG